MLKNLQNHSETIIVKHEESGPSQKDIREAIAILRTELQDALGRSFAFVSGAVGQLENIQEAMQVHCQFKIDGVRFSSFSQLQFLF